MVSMRIEEKPAFTIIGRKTWIPGRDNEVFGRFWQQCGKEGLFEILSILRGDQPGSVTQGMVLGVSCVEKDPTNRSFYFYIGIEYDRKYQRDDFETYDIPASTWAIFCNSGTMPDSLVASEIYAFGEWLPNSGYVHANVPEIEVYPPCDTSGGNVLTEFWLPIRPKV